MTQTPLIPTQIPAISRFEARSIPETNDTTRINNGVVVTIIPIFDALDNDNPTIAVTVFINIPKKAIAAMSGICSRRTAIDSPRIFTVANSNRETTGSRNPLKTKTLNVSGVLPMAYLTETAPSPQIKQVKSIARSPAPNRFVSFLSFNVINVPRKC